MSCKARQWWLCKKWEKGYSISISLHYTAVNWNCYLLLMVFSGYVLRKFHYFNTLARESNRLLSHHGNDEGSSRNGKCDDESRILNAPLRKLTFTLSTLVRKELWQRENKEEERERGRRKVAFGTTPELYSSRCFRIRRFQIRYVHYPRISFRIIE